MDHEENLQEQLEIANDVMKIWDSCDENGEFTDSQTIELTHAAYRLAELVQAMNAWSTAL